MKPLLLTLSLAAVLCALMPQKASALSRPLPSPQLNFPQGNTPARAAQVLPILNEPQAHYLGGLISYWPPNWWTILNYNGDTGALDSMLASLVSVKGLHITLSFMRGTASSTPGSWTVEYSQVTPNKIALIINLKSPNLDLTKLQLPEYPAGEASSPSAGFPRAALVKPSGDHGSRADTERLMTGVQTMAMNGRGWM